MRKQQFNSVESETFRAPELIGEKRDKNHSRREKKARGSRELERELESSSSALLEENANCCSLCQDTQYAKSYRLKISNLILNTRHPYQTAPTRQGRRQCQRES